MGCTLADMDVYLAPMLQSVTVRRIGPSLVTEIVLYPWRTWHVFYHLREQATGVPWGVNRFQ